MRWRDTVVAAGIACIVTVVTAVPALDRLDGFSIDILFWLRHQVYGPVHEPETSPSVVIAIDEETYRRPPFEGIPKVMWTPHLASVLNEVLDAGALVVGQDIILPTSVEKYIKGYDRDYLLALREGGRSGRLVLGKLQHLKPISPYPGHSFAVGNQRNIRLANLYRDRDGIVRRIPLQFHMSSADGSARIEPSMALELAARAVGGVPETRENGEIALNGYVIPASSKNTMLLNFDSGGGGIPVYSMADLFACSEAGRAEFFREHFAGKVVLIGAVLDSEDRKLTSSRFISSAEGAWFAARCELPVMSGLYGERIVRDTIPGVFAFATAVNNILRQEVLRKSAPELSLAVILSLSFAAGLVILSFSPVRAWLILTGGAVTWAFVSTGAFRAGLVLPLLDPLAGSVFTFSVLLAYRLRITDKQKRYIRQVFTYYLPASVIDRMVDSNRLPTLGGETRELTVWFSDLAGFTALSEKLSPTEVVSFMNQYLSAMTEIIEEHGGFVDKYIGDAIVAVFGAPMEDQSHASHAVAAALACQQRLAEIAPKLGLPGDKAFHARIGINTGNTLIGNIGSSRRFNYTVMGDTVNLAARLEGVNKDYETAILLSQHTAESCEADFLLCEVDTVRVAGRKEPVRIYEPLGQAGELSREQEEQHRQFAAALGAFRARDFAAAAAQFLPLAEEYPVAGRLAERARAFAADPPPDDWDGIHDLNHK